MEVGGLTKNDQFFLITTWVMTLANNPTSLGLFFFHPILQSLSIALFAYGAFLLPVRRVKMAPTYARHTLTAAA